MPIRPLTAYRVVDMTRDRGEMGARLFSDLGAEVVMVEPPGGSPSRSLPPIDGDHSLFFTLRNCGKLSVELALDSGSGRDALDSLLACSDVVFDSAEPNARITQGLEAEALADRHPHLVVVSITAYGRTGPWAGRDVPGAVVDATSGMAFKAGLPDREPLLPPGNVSGDTPGVMAAFAALAALIQRGSTGYGQLIDLSANEATAQITDWSLPNSTRTHRRGRCTQRDPSRPRSGVHDQRVP